MTAERFAAQPPTRPDEFLRVVPNLAVEILSSSTAKRDQTEKKDIYARNGVEEYWIVDPRRKVVTIFHLGGRGYEAGRSFATGTLQSKVLPKLRVAVEKLFVL